jgi:hypothetical protein
MASACKHNLIGGGRSYNTITLKTSQSYILLVFVASTMLNKLGLSCLLLKLITKFTQNVAPP